MKEEKIELRNEYASIKIVVDRSGNGPRVKIIDLLNGDERYLDPLQLECLVRMDFEFFDKYLPY